MKRCKIGGLESKMRKYEAKLFIFSASTPPQRVEREKSLKSLTRTRASRFQIPVDVRIFLADIPQIFNIFNIDSLHE